MVITCNYCSENCTKTKGYVVCVLCSNKYHIDCANKINSKLTKSMLEEISKSNGGLVFRCDKCFNDPPAKSDLSELLSRFTILENQMKSLQEQVTKDVIGQLTDIKGDLINCSSRMVKFEEATNTKLSNLEMENNFLHRQINRSDIIIRGIPSVIGNEKLISTVINIGKKYDDSFGDCDINFCSFINKRKAVLLKLNNIHKRDGIIMRYRADLRKDYAAKLMVSDVMQSDINSRIFLDDNCTPIETKLRYVCRDLKRNGIINGYKISYRRSYKVNVFLINGTEKELSTEKIAAYAARKITKDELFA